MKKLLFSAIAMIAFSVDSSAQTSDKGLNDSLDCWDKADKYLKTKKGWSMYTKEYADLIKDTFYAGCMEGKKKDKATVETDKTISRG